MLPFLSLCNNNINEELLKVLTKLKINALLVVHS